MSNILYEYRDGALHATESREVPLDETPAWWPASVALGGCGHATCGCSCSDGPRYRMLGNSVAVPVVNWIAWRLR